LQNKPNNKLQRLTRTSLPCQCSKQASAGTKQKKSFLYSDFTNHPDQKFIGLNPDDSANPNTTKKFLFFCTEQDWPMRLQLIKPCTNQGDQNELSKV
jgi:hypothetical protein